MIKSIFFALLFAACCPSKPQHIGDFQPISYDTKPVLYAKIDGNIVLYHYSAYEPGAYEKEYPEMSKGLEYIGSGVHWTYNGVLQNDTFGRVSYFWRKKFVGTGE